LVCQDNYPRKENGFYVEFRVKSRRELHWQGKPTIVVRLHGEFVMIILRLT